MPKIRVAAVGDDKRDVRALLAQLEPSAKIVKEKKLGDGDLIVMSLASYTALSDAAKTPPAAPAKPARSRAAAARPAAADGPRQASVRVWREHRGITQDELARRVGLSKSFLSEIENGKKTGSIKTLRAIAEALGIDLTRLAV
ncbi:MAG: helix-turn-helix transcriptional regulator [Sneathiellaceae bacterium]